MVKFPPKLFTIFISFYAIGGRILWKIKYCLTFTKSLGQVFPINVSGGFRTEQTTATVTILGKTESLLLHQAVLSITYSLAFTNSKFA